MLHGYTHPMYTQFIDIFITDTCIVDIEVDKEVLVLVNFVWLQLEVEAQRAPRLLVLSIFLLQRLATLGEQTHNKTPRGQFILRPPEPQHSHTYIYAVHYSPAGV